MASLLLHLVALAPLGGWWMHGRREPGEIIQLVAQFSLAASDSMDEGTGGHGSLVEILGPAESEAAEDEVPEGQNESVAQTSMTVEADEPAPEEPFEDKAVEEQLDLEPVVAELTPPRLLPDFLQPEPQPERQPAPDEAVTLVAAVAEREPRLMRQPARKATAEPDIETPVRSAPPKGIAAATKQQAAGNGVLPGAGGGGGKPSASFFGIQGEGLKVVYLIDASGSMNAHNAFGLAKAELLESLAALGARQRFQVMFYNNAVYQWMREGSTDKLPFATDVHKNLVRQFIRKQGVKGGTQHLVGLEAALALQPDLIFLLTDGRQDMPPEDLESLRRRCQGRCTIHAVEFGVGEPPGDESFLGVLARMTGGTAVYRDVTQPAE